MNPARNRLILQQGRFCDRKIWGASFAWLASSGFFLALAFASCASEASQPFQATVQLGKKLAAGAASLGGAKKDSGGNLRFPVIAAGSAATNANAGLLTGKAGISKAANPFSGDAPPLPAAPNKNPVNSPSKQAPASTRPAQQPQGSGGSKNGSTAVSHGHTAS